MPVYDTRIVREQGGSVLATASGGSVNFAAGALLSVSGKALFNSGASVHIDDGASLIIKDGATAHNSPVVILNAGPNQFWFAPGSAGSPTFSASPGDFLWIANSASTTWWANVSNGTAGSVWAVMAKILGTSAVPGAI